MAHISTAFSDLVLATSVLWGILQMTSSGWDTYLYAVIGFAIIWCAALAGMIRFGLQNPPSGISDAHDILHWMSMTVALACIAAQVANDNGYEKPAYCLLGIGALHAVGSQFLDRDNKVHADDAVLFVSVGSILILSLMARSLFGTLGCAVLIGVRLSSSNQGVDIDNSHYELVKYGQAAAMYCFYRLLTNDVKIDVLEEAKED